MSNNNLIIISVVVLFVVAFIFGIRPTNNVDNFVPEDAFMHSIQLAFNAYLKNSTEGIDEDAITGESTKGTDMRCGLDNFDKSLFESNYSIQKIEDSKYGGKVGHIVFANKPDMTFWTWVYNIGDSEQPEYILRAFCKE